EHSGWISSQCPQQRKLLLGEGQLLPAQPDLSGQRIELERPDPQPARPGTPAASAQQRQQPRLKLGIAEGLYKVVIATALEPAEPVELARATREHEDGNVGVEPACNPV